MQLTGTSIARMARDVREAYPAGESLALDLGGLTIEVRTNNADLAGRLENYFKAFTTPVGEADIVITAHEAPEPDPGRELTVKQPDPGKTKVKEEYADLADGRMVRKRLTGMVFLFGGGENVAVGPCGANDNQVVNFVNNRHIEHLLNRGCLLGHAAAVLHGGRGVALAGFSGAGKSTLALHCMSRGTDFVSNDRLMVRAGGEGLEMVGVAKQPRINPGTALNNPDLARVVSDEDREAFGDLPLEELWSLEHKYDALIEECYGAGRFRLAAPMHALVVLNWKRDGGPTVIREVDPRLRRDLLPAFIKAPGLFYRPDGGIAPGPRPDEDYVDALTRCALIEMSGGVDFDAAADACLRFMETGSL